MPVSGFQVEQDRGGDWKQSRNSLCILVPFVSRLKCHKCLATNTAQYLLAGVFSGLLCSKCMVLATLIPT